LPAGLAYDRSDAIILNPDEEVQARLRLVFAKFRELQSARAVMRYLLTQRLPVPVRVLLGPAPHDVVWREADGARVRSILHNRLCRRLRLRPPAAGQLSAVTAGAGGNY
jgi:uncharacterized protein YcbX